MANNNWITCSKEILGGTAVFKGTRVPVKTLIDYLQGGDRLKDFLNGSPKIMHYGCLILPKTHC